MKKSTIKSIIKWAVIVMVACTFFFGGFDGLKTKISDLITPPTTETPAE
jgi:hypothetical protein